jgi:rhodanese-related sulfurtransferase
MAKIDRVSPSEAKQLMDEGYVYLDVRTEQEYAAGHPVGAHNLPVLFAGSHGMEPNADFLRVAEALYPKDARIVVGCRSGHRSMRAAELLVGAGFQHVVDQRAGFDGARDAFGGLAEPGWSPAGLPVETKTVGGSYAERRTLAGAT